jgi:BirA family biotin operon repressor/biotin-[acetyl-CoA-carboxylase] ligase
MNRDTVVIPPRTAPDRLAVAGVTAHLATRWLGRNLVCFDAVTSTNDVVRRLAQGDAPVGTVVIAERQTAGRGRMRRRWESAPGLGIWCSMLVLSEPGMSPGALALLVAAGAAAALKHHGAKAVAVKWPNDLVALRIDGEEGSDPSPLESPRRWPDAWAAGARKLGGILVERAPASGLADPMTRYIVGLGVNVHHRETDFPQQLRAHATSLVIVRAGFRGQGLSRGASLSRAAVLGSILGEVERRVDVVRFGTSSECAAIVEEWNDLSPVVGRDVAVVDREAEYPARAVRIETDGGLLVEVGGGRRTLRDASVRTVCERRPGRGTAAA